MEEAGWNRNTFFPFLLQLQSHLEEFNVLFLYMKN